MQSHNLMVAREPRVRRCHLNEAAQDGDHLRPYPDPEPLRELLAAYHGVAPGNVLMFPGGADTAIDVTMRSLAPASRVVRTDPAFPRYAHWIRLNGHTEVLVPVQETTEGWTVSADALVAASRDAEAVIVDPSGNPTGARISRETVDRVRTATGGLLVIDCVYESHLPAEDRYLTEVVEMANSVSLGSFSKSAGLAGLRIGYVIGAQAVLASLRPFEAVFGISTLQIARAMAALEEVSR